MNLLFFTTTMWMKRQIEEHVLNVYRHVTEIGCFLRKIQFPRIILINRMPIPETFPIIWSNAMGKCAKDFHSYSFVEHIFTFICMYDAWNKISSTLSRFKWIKPSKLMKKIIKNKSIIPICVDILSLPSKIVSCNLGNVIPDPTNANLIVRTLELSLHF